MLEQRMYFLVPYQLIGIQKGIQAGHVALEYAYKYKDEPEAVDGTLWAFVRDWKTFIVLNGGTTNDGTPVYNPKTKQMEPYYGTMNLDLKKIEEINYKHLVFREPDLGNIITCICLIVDERVFNRKEYPDFYFPSYSSWLNNPTTSDIVLNKEKYNQFRDLEYAAYVKRVGKEIAVLKEILNTKEKANG